MDSAYDLLAAQPFLAGLSRSQLDKLSFWTKKSYFHAGARLFEEGGRADRFWILREGHVTLDTHVPGRPDAVVETLGPDAVLGWSWLFHPYRWHFGASAVETTLALELDVVLYAVYRLDSQLNPVQKHFIDLVRQLAQQTLAPR